MELSSAYPDSSFAFVLAIPVCCIYHKPKRFDESSDESSSSSDSDSGSSSECNHHHHEHSHGRSRPGRRPARDGDGEGSTRQRGDADSAPTIEDLSDSDTNAYEAQPSGKKWKQGKGKRPAGELHFVLWSSSGG